MASDNVLDPVFEQAGQWYFWEETWTCYFGPFGTQNLAARACQSYALGLEDPDAAANQLMEDNELHEAIKKAVWAP